MPIKLPLIAALLMSGLAANAATIVNVTGPSPFGFGSSIGIVEGFNLTTAYTGVSITMPLQDNSVGGPIGGTEGTIYLVNQIGAGATAANNVAAPVLVSGLAASFTTIPVFSGLTLGPGNYYLVLIATNGGSFQSMTPEGSSFPVVTLGGGVTALGSTSVSAGISPFPPATTWLPLSSPGNIFVDVTGTASAVPEPSALWLAPAGIAALVLRKRAALARSRGCNA